MLDFHQTHNFNTDQPTWPEERKDASEGGYGGYSRKRKRDHPESSPPLQMDDEYISSVMYEARLADRIEKSKALIKQSQHSHQKERTTYSSDSHYKPRNASMRTNPAHKYQSPWTSSYSSTNQSSAYAKEYYGGSPRRSAYTGENYASSSRRRSAYAEEPFSSSKIKRSSDAPQYGKIYRSGASYDYEKKEPYEYERTRSYERDVERYRRKRRQRSRSPVSTRSSSTKNYSRPVLCTQTIAYSRPTYRSHSPERPRSPVHSYKKAGDRRERGRGRTIYSSDKKRKVDYRDIFREEPKRFREESKRFREEPKRAPREESKSSRRRLWKPPTGSLSRDRRKQEEEKRKPKQTGYCAPFVGEDPRTRREGKIDKLFTDPKWEKDGEHRGKNYGFIQESGSERRWFFIPGHLRNDNFFELKKGTKVSFILGQNPKSWRWEAHHVYNIEIETPFDTTPAKKPQPFTEEDVQTEPQTPWPDKMKLTKIPKKDSSLVKKKNKHEENVSTKKETS